MAQQRFSLAELYKTDLERHLFTPSPPRTLRPPRSALLIGAQIRAWWSSGWSRWKSALAAVTSL